MIRAARYAIAGVLIAALTAIPRAESPSLYDVFVSSALSGNKPGLYFVDARTGLSTVAVTNGTAHTRLGNTVIFVRKDTGQVGIAYPDGRVEPHPFIEVSGGDTVSWAVSADRNWIAWAVGHTQAGSLLSDLYVARADGTEKQLALHNSSSKAVSLRPLAITNDGTTVFYARQSDESGLNRAYLVVGEIDSLNVATGESAKVPGEPRCACAAAFGADGKLIFRLEAAAPGFAAHFIDLSIKVDVPLPSTNALYAQAGYALLSDKGNYAAYSMAKSAPTVPASKTASDSYLIVLADSSARRQRVILDARPDKLRPLAFEQDALILVGVDKDGTYKLSLGSGALTQVSAYTYLGTLNG